LELADALQLFDARRSRWTNPDGTLSREAQFFVRELWLRAGGALGPSTNDLATAAFEDAGISEQLGMIQALADGGRQNPPQVDLGRSDGVAPPLQPEERVAHLETQVASLLAVVDDLAKTVAALQQGLYA
jgi:hypothetical protein